MMESETPPPDSPSQEAGDLEVSSRRAALGPLRPEDNPIVTRSPQCPALEESKQKSLAPSGMRSDVLRELLERAAISEEHRMLVGTVMVRICPPEAECMNPLRVYCFEVREMIYFLIVPHIFRCALCR